MVTEEGSGATTTNLSRSLQKCVTESILCYIILKDKEIQATIIK